MRKSGPLLKVGVNQQLVSKGLRGPQGGSAQIVEALMRIKPRRPKGSDF
jgi:hypothetical protein